jgi:hypothetical protein
MVRLVKARDGETVLAEAPFAWQPGRAYRLALEAAGDRLDAWLDGAHLFGLEDRGTTLTGGGVGLVCTEGTLSVGAVGVAAARMRE